MAQAGLKSQLIYGKGIVTVSVPVMMSGIVIVSMIGCMKPVMRLLRRIHRKIQPFEIGFIRKKTDTAVKQRQSFQS